MKTKTFFMLSLFMGIALTWLSAQDYYPPPPQNPVVEGTKSVVWYGDYYISEWVECGGVGRLIEGNMTWQNISHFVDGVEVWEISKARGEFTDYYTSEVFWVNETVKQSITGAGTCSTNLKLIGNKSSHYIMKWVWNADWSNMTYSIVCPGKD